MNQFTLFAWFSGIQIIVVFFINTLLFFKLRRYFLASGFGIVTLTLVSKVVAHLLVEILYAVGYVAFLINGENNHTFFELNNLGTLWLTSSMLLHAMVLTFQRVICIFYVKRFLSLSRSKTYISLMIVFEWVVAILLTGVTYKSKSAQTKVVFNIGFLITGVLTIVNFICTKDTKIFRDCDDISYSISSHQKAFKMFAGLLFSFAIFCLPISLPNLVIALKGKNISQSASAIMSMWLFLGVVFDCLWILIRLRSTVNNINQFYSQWTTNKKQAEKHYPLLLLKVQK